MAPDAEAIDKVPVEINDLVQVRLSGEEESASYRSRVDDLQDKKLILDWPSDAGIRMPVHKNQTLSIVFIRQDAVYSFDVHVEECHSTPVPKIIALPIGATQRIQRRSYFRVRCSQPVQLTGTVELSSASGDKKSNVLHIVTHTLDLSGAGMAIYYKSALPVGSVFDIRLTLEDGHPPMKLLGRVVHAEPVSRGSNIPIYHMGFFFLAVSEAQRTILVRHCFRMQQKSLSQ